MHELPVAENLLEITLRHARQANAKRVTDLYLVVGQLSSIIDDSIQFYWDIISEDSIAEGAVLHFRRIPTRMQCRFCEHQFSPAGDDFACPECQSTQVHIVAGEEFFLESINIDE
jgi:hydrogenase nickel incorporation protein HypA/HybF